MINLIETLKAAYSAEPQNFDFTASMYISGPGKRMLRIELMEYLTGAKLPVSKCNFHAVVDMLKINFNQITLF